MRTVEANNKIPDSKCTNEHKIFPSKLQSNSTHNATILLYVSDVSQNVISVSGDIPFITGYLRGAGKEFYNTLIIEVARIYGDDPQRAINAFISFLKHDGSPKVSINMKVCCLCILNYIFKLNFHFIHLNFPFHLKK